MSPEIKNIETLKKEFDAVSSTDNLAFVNFFEKNINSVENINPDKDEAHYNAKLHLECEYGISLFGSGQYTRAVEVLSQSISMFENAPSQDKSELKNISYFEHLLWSYAVSLYETKAINSSIKQFERLVEYKPTNDKYISWLKTLKRQKMSKLIKPLWILIFAWLIGKFTFFENFDSKLQLISSLVGGGLLVIAVGFELYIHLTKLKPRTK